MKLLTFITKPSSVWTPDNNHREYRMNLKPKHSKVVKRPTEARRFLPVLSDQQPLTSRPPQRWLIQCCLHTSTANTWQQLSELFTAAVGLIWSQRSWLSSQSTVAPPWPPFSVKALWGTEDLQAPHPHTYGINTNKQKKLKLIVAALFLFSVFGWSSSTNPSSSPAWSKHTLYPAGLLFLFQNRM